MFSFGKLTNRKVFAAIAASILSISLGFMAKSNLPSTASSRFSGTQQTGLLRRSPTGNRGGIVNYRTPANNRVNSPGNRRINPGISNAQVSKKAIVRNYQSPGNSVAQSREPRRRFPIRSDSTPVTNRFGATGSRPSSARWQAEIKRRYGIDDYPTPVTNRFNRFSASGRKISNELWRSAIKRNYGIESAGTPVTNRFGATGRRPSSELWRAEIKRRYGIGDAVKPGNESR